jgi:hypothetical protein
MYPLTLGLPLSPSLVWDPANPEWPEVIPDLIACQYVVVDAFPSGGFRDKESGRVIEDDEFHEMLLDRRRQGGAGVRLFAMPLTHMAYAQALQLKAEQGRELADGGDVTIDRARCRFQIGRQWYAVRLAWLQTPSSVEHGFGSAAWTPDRGRAAFECAVEFERLNPQLFG